MNYTDGQVIAGNRGQGSGLDQLNQPSDVMLEAETDSLIICDQGNRRIMRWSRRMGTTAGEIFLSNIDCFGCTMDDQKFLYISDWQKHEVQRYRKGDLNGTIVAGGNGAGDQLNQLNFPTYIIVDRQQDVYVSDNLNSRVMKWSKGALAGIIVAGGQGGGDALTQLSFPQGLFVDVAGTLYVSDHFNHRIMRWPQGSTAGTVLVGGNGLGNAQNQLNWPISLFFDHDSNLYVTDLDNNRVQRFSILYI